MLTNSSLQSADKPLFTACAGMQLSDIDVFDPEGSGSEPCIAVFCAAPCTCTAGRLHAARYRADHT